MSERAELGERARELGGRAVGVLFLAGFGTLWMVTSLVSLHRMTAVVGVTVAAVAMLLLGGAWRLSARMERLLVDDPREETAEDLRVKRVFRQVNVAQWVLIPIAVVVLSLLHRPEWIVPAIATIVGLHLLPLARVFRYFPHYVTGTLLVVWSVLSIMALPRALVPGYGALGTATILLGSAAYTLLRSYAAARRLSPASDVGE